MNQDSMTKVMFNASCRMMLEIVKGRDIERLEKYFDHLNEMYCYEEAMKVVEKVAKGIVKNDPPLYEWLVEKIEELYIDEEIYVNSVDVVHILLDEGLVRGRDFQEHPSDPDKVKATYKTYLLLKELIEDIHEIVEVAAPPFD